MLERRKKINNTEQIVETKSLYERALEDTLNGFKGSFAASNYIKNDKGNVDMKRAGMVSGSIAAFGTIFKNIKKITSNPTEILEDTVRGTNNAIAFAKESATRWLSNKAITDHGFGGLNVEAVPKQLAKLFSGYETLDNKGIEAKAHEIMSILKDNPPIEGNVLYAYLDMILTAGVKTSTIFGSKQALQNPNSPKGIKLKYAFVTIMKESKENAQAQSSIGAETGLLKAAENGATYSQDASRITGLAGILSSSIRYIGTAGVAGSVNLMPVGLKSLIGKAAGPLGQFYGWATTGLLARKIAEDQKLAVGTLVQNFGSLLTADDFEILVNENGEVEKHPDGTPKITLKDAKQSEFARIIKSRDDATIKRIGLSDEDSFAIRGIKVFANLTEQTFGKFTFGKSGNEISVADTASYQAAVSALAEIVTNLQTKKMRLLVSFDKGIEKLMRTAKNADGLETPGLSLENAIKKQFEKVSEQSNVPSELGAEYLKLKQHNPNFAQEFRAKQKEVVKSSYGLEEDTTKATQKLISEIVSKIANIADKNPQLMGSLKKFVVKMQEPDETAKARMEMVKKMKALDLEFKQGKINQEYKNLAQKIIMVEMDKSITDKGNESGLKGAKEYTISLISLAMSQMVIGGITSEIAGLVTENQSLFVASLTKELSKQSGKIKEAELYLNQEQHMLDKMHGDLVGGAEKMTNSIIAVANSEITGSIIGKVMLERPVNAAGPQDTPVEGTQKVEDSSIDIGEGLDRMGKKIKGMFGSENPTLEKPRTAKTVAEIFQQVATEKGKIAPTLKIQEFKVTINGKQISTIGLIGHDPDEAKQIAKETNSDMFGIGSLVFFPPKNTDIKLVNTSEIVSNIISSAKTNDTFLDSTKFAPNTTVKEITNVSNIHYLNRGSKLDGKSFGPGDCGTIIELKNTSGEVEIFTVIGVNERYAFLEKISKTEILTSQAEVMRRTGEIHDFFKSKGINGIWTSSNKKNVFPASADTEGDVDDHEDDHEESGKVNFDESSARSQMVGIPEHYKSSVLNSLKNSHFAIIFEKGKVGSEKLTGFILDTEGKTRKLSWSEFIIESNKTNSSLTDQKTRNRMKQDAEKFGHMISKSKGEPLSLVKENPKTIDKNGQPETDKQDSEEEVNPPKPERSEIVRNQGTLIASNNLRGLNFDFGQNNQEKLPETPIPLNLERPTSNKVPAFNEIHVKKQIGSALVDLGGLKLLREYGFFAYLDGKAVSAWAIDKNGKIVKFKSLNEIIQVVQEYEKAPKNSSFGAKQIAGMKNSIGALNLPTYKKEVFNIPKMGEKPPVVIVAKRAEELAKKVQEELTPKSPETQATTTEKIKSAVENVPTKSPGTKSFDPKNRIGNINISPEDRIKLNKIAETNQGIATYYTGGNIIAEVKAGEIKVVFNQEDIVAEKYKNISAITPEQIKILDGYRAKLVPQNTQIANNSILNQDLSNPDGPLANVVRKGGIVTGELQKLGGNTSLGFRNFLLEVKAGNITPEQLTSLIKQNKLTFGIGLPQEKLIQIVNNPKLLESVLKITGNSSITNANISETNTQSFGLNLNLLSYLLGGNPFGVNIEFGETFSVEFNGKTTTNLEELYFELVKLEASTNRIEELQTQKPTEISKAEIAKLLKEQQIAIKSLTPAQIKELKEKDIIANVGEFRARVEFVNSLDVTLPNGKKFIVNDQKTIEAIKNAKTQEEKFAIIVKHIKETDRTNPILIGLKDFYAPINTNSITETQYKEATIAANKVYKNSKLLFSGVRNSEGVEISSQRVSSAYALKQLENNPLKAAAFIKALENQVDEKNRKTMVATIVEKYKGRQLTPALIAKIIKDLNPTEIYDGIATASNITKEATLKAVKTALANENSVMYGFGDDLKAAAKKYENASPLDEAKAYRELVQVIENYNQVAKGHYEGQDTGVSLLERIVKAPTNTKELEEINTYLGLRQQSGKTKSNSRVDLDGKIEGTSARGEIKFTDTKKFRYEDGTTTPEQKAEQARLFELNKIIQQNGSGDYLPQIFNQASKFGTSGVLGVAPSWSSSEMSSSYSVENLGTAILANVTSNPKYEELRNKFDSEGYPREAAHKKTLEIIFSGYTDANGKPLTADQVRQLIKRQNNTYIQFGFGELTNGSKTTRPIIPRDSRPITIPQNTLDRDFQAQLTATEKQFLGVYHKLRNMVPSRGTPFKESSKAKSLLESKGFKSGQILTGKQLQELSGGSSLIITSVLGANGKLKTETAILTNGGQFRLKDVVMENGVQVLKFQDMKCTNDGLSPSIAKSLEEKIIAKAQLDFTPPKATTVFSGVSKTIAENQSVTIEFNPPKPKTQEPTKPVKKPEKPQAPVKTEPVPAAQPPGSVGQNPPTQLNVPKPGGDVVSGPTISNTAPTVGSPVPSVQPVTTPNPIGNQVIPTPTIPATPPPVGTGSTPNLGSPTNAGIPASTSILGNTAPSGPIIPTSLNTGNISPVGGGVIPDTIPKTPDLGP